MSMGGDNDGDDHVAMSLWDELSGGGCYELPAWSKSPRTLQAEASSMLHGAFAGVNAAAGKHSNPPCVPTHQRLL